MKILMVIIMIIFYAFVIWPSREVTVYCFYLFGLIQLSLKKQ